MARGTRPRGKRIEVWVSEAEHQQILENSKGCKLSGSAYLRLLGLGYEPKSQFDQDSIKQLVKLHADQGRLGGLLKLWLSTRPGEGSRVKDVRSLLDQIESLQILLAKHILKEAKKL